MSTDGQADALPAGNLRPIVRTSPAGNRALWIFAALLLIVAALLFEALNARREQLGVPATQAVPSNGAMVTAPPPLVLPPQLQTAPQPVYPNLAPPALAPARPVALAPAPRVVSRVPVRQAPVPQAPYPVPPYVPPPTVIENGPPAQTDLTAAAPAAATRPAANERVLAGRLRNPALTVPQGTVIAAVLETALDSTRPGGARAIVQRDVMGFDGTRVLIPRGSRLYGEYQSDVASGQKRALIRWTRLTRPDAVIVNLDSPSADPLGRAGVEGKVNSHFFARFGGAILQSVLNAGVGVATSAALKNGAFVALPGTAAQTVPNLQPQQVQPTLKVRQGTSVSVFVARDLDFSSVQQ
jgi:type IV secretion system protein VirB10